VKIFGHRRQSPTEAELLDRISRRLRDAYAPTPIWQYLLCMAVITALAFAFGWR